jgi:1-acyl-sn-glycerol-3-phosphate acyltransferase
MTHARVFVQAGNVHGMTAPDMPPRPDRFDHSDTASPTLRRLDPIVLAQRTHGWTVEQWAQLEPRLAYHATRAVVAGWLRSCWRLGFYGAELVPVNGATLVTPNHSSWLDGWIQALGHRRMPRWMGKQELIDAPVLGSYLRRGGVFPVDRGGADATAIDIAAVLLESGQHVVVYPEGTRIRSAGTPDGLGTPRRGAARLALSTGAPIQPVATFGLKPDTGRGHLARAVSRVPFARRVTTIYGEPWSVPAEHEPTRARVDEVRDEIWARVRELYELAREASLEPRPPRELQLPGGRVVRRGMA